MSNNKEVDAVLMAVEVNGTVVKLPPGQLERKVYEGVKKALEGIGGKWKGGNTQGFVFASDPSELIAKIHGGERPNLKKEYQFFPTPNEVADFLCQQVRIYAIDHVLEPSAGDGALVKAIQRARPGITVDVYELMPQNLAILAKMPDVTVEGEDFLEAHPRPVYSIIIANPPFTKNQDIDHVLHMYKFLNDGGTLVSVMSKHFTFSENRKETEFREWLYSVEATIIPLDAGAFKQSGTMIETVVVKITKK